MSNTQVLLGTTQLFLKNGTNSINTLHVRMTLSWSEYVMPTSRLPPMLHCNCLQHRRDQQRPAHMFKMSRSAMSRIAIQTSDDVSWKPRSCDVHNTKVVRRSGVQQHMILIDCYKLSVKLGYYFQLLFTITDPESFLHYLWYVLPMTIWHKLRYITVHISILVSFKYGCIFSNQVMHSQVMLIYVHYINKVTC